MKKENNLLDNINAIEVPIRVELGRTKLFIKHLRNLGEGSIIELDSLAGEPVNIFANNILIAQGEVIVIDENFGIRITDMVENQRL